VTGRVALVDLAAGEAVTETRLARVRAGPVASLIPEGYRAFAVPTSLPPGTVVPGDHVDVLATYGAGQLQADAVLDGAEVVLVLGPTSASGSRGSGGIGLPAGAVAAAVQTTLVLLVTPEQEQRLAFARAFAVLDVTVQPPAGAG